VDGITATAILYEFLKHIGADVSFYIPHRVEEGYGLKPEQVISFAVPNRVKLIVTVDCGSNSNDAITAAKQAGIDTIITDHHKIAAPPPAAVAVINPQRSDCVSDFKELAGVGVTFCLLICLRAYLREQNFFSNTKEPNLKNICDLVSLGTIADVVPLKNENRILSKIGIDIINLEKKRPGLLALTRECSLDNKHVTAEDIAFKLSPRLNAAGRLEHADMAVRLLTTSNPETALQISKKLTGLNTRRKTIQDTIMKDIRVFLKNNPEELNKKSMVIAGLKWHEGVLGIVASKLTEQYFKPVVLLTVKNDIAKGSARSIPGFNLYQNLLKCTGTLDNFGGHSMAAGLTLQQKNISAFKTAFEETTGQVLKKNLNPPELVIDAPIDFDQMTPDLIDEIEHLQPFGAGNPEPVFYAENIEVLYSKIVGSTHRRMVLRQSTSKNQDRFNAIHFNVNEIHTQPDRFAAVVFSLQWNRWNGKKTKQLIIKDVK